MSVTSATKIVNSAKKLIKTKKIQNFQKIFIKLASFTKMRAIAKIALKL
jgi:hypothetical protein